MHVFMNNSYIKEKLQFDIYIGVMTENVQQLSRTDRRNSLFSDKCMDALARKTPVMFEPVDRGHRPEPLCRTGAYFKMRHM